MRDTSIFSSQYEKIDTIHCSRRTISNDSYRCGLTLQVMEFVLWEGPKERHESYYGGV